MPRDSRKNEALRAGIEMLEHLEKNAVTVDGYTITYSPDGALAKMRAALDERRCNAKLRSLVSMMGREIPPDVQEEFDALLRAIRATNPTGIGENDS